MVPRVPATGRGPAQWPLPPCAINFWSGTVAEKRPPHSHLRRSVCSLFRPPSPRETGGSLDGRPMDPARHPFLCAGHTFGDALVTDTDAEILPRLLLRHWPDYPRNRSYVLVWCVRCVLLTPHSVPSPPPAPPSMRPLASEHGDQGGGPQRLSGPVRRRLRYAPAAIHRAQPGVRARRQSGFISATPTRPLYCGVNLPSGFKGHNGRSVVVVVDRCVIVGLFWPQIDFISHFFVYRE